MRVVAALLIAALCVGRPALALDAGAAKVEITPPVGTPLNGYGYRQGRPSTAVHDPVWARALYLDDGTTRLVIVNCDLVFINHELRQRVVELAPQEIPREHVILTATHTHSAQGAMNPKLPLRFVAGRYSQEVLDATARGIVQAIQEAYTARKRAAIGFGTFKQNDLSSNRRVDKGPIDEQIGILKVDDADGNPIAVVTNFAAHPTSLGDEHLYSISADYPGFYYAELEALSSGCTALFLNGAEGNQTIGSGVNAEGWGRTEAVGRGLARRVHAKLKDIDCGELPLVLKSVEAELPPTLAAFQPRTVLLQSLEIGGLLINFVPGEPVVEVGAELRRKAIARGYAAQFTVSLANDYINYFIPRAFYPETHYESSMHFFGPGMEDWFHEQFGAMMSLGDAPEPRTTPALEERGLGPATVLSLAEDAYARGVQRGERFAEDIQAQFQQRVVLPIESGAALPRSGPWAVWPPLLNAAPLALPIMGMTARARLAPLSMDLRSEMEGIAAGAGLPFDAVWLLQNARDLAMREDTAPLFGTPLCTMFAVTGPRAGRDGLLVGRNLDWAASEPPVISLQKPKDAHQFLQIGFSWNVGAFTGMNDAGLVLCVEELDSSGTPGAAAPPVELLVRDVLASAGSFEKAVEALSALQGQAGRHVLVAGPSAEGPRAAVVEYGAKTLVRMPDDDGLLLGVAPSHDTADSDTLIRHARVADLWALDTEGGIEAIQRVLTDAEPERKGMARIWNENTRHAVIFEPMRKAFSAAFPGADGLPSAFSRMAFSELRP